MTNKEQLHNAVRRLINTYRRHGDCYDEQGYLDDDRFGWWLEDMDWQVTALDNLVPEPPSEQGDSYE